MTEEQYLSHTFSPYGSGYLICLKCNLILFVDTNNKARFISNKNINRDSYIKFNL